MFGQTRDLNNRQGMSSGSRQVYGDMVSTSRQRGSAMRCQNPMWHQLRASGSARRRCTV